MAGITYGTGQHNATLGHTETVLV